MKIKKATTDLEAALVPYRVLWEEWIRDERCNLTDKEIAVIHLCSKNNFESKLFSGFVYNLKPAMIKKIIRRLEVGYVLFIDLVVYKFLCKVISMGKETGQKNFLNMPLEELNISETAKNNLKAFGIRCISDLAQRFRIEELGCEANFKNILAFLHAEMRKPNYCRRSPLA